MKRFLLLVCLFFLLLLVPAGVLADTTTTTTTVVPTTSPVISGPPQLTSITPSSADTNTTVSITSLAGSNFASNAGIRMKGSSKDILGSVTSVNYTTIIGTFDLDNQVPGDYQVCVYNNATSYTCGLPFTITTPGEITTTASSIFFETNPPGATVLLSGTRIGTSVFTYNNATPGTYKVVIQMNGYQDYTGTVTVLEGTRTKFYAPLTPLGAGTPAATATPAPTATTIRKSTLKVPTSWPSDTPTSASPVDPAVIIGAAGLGLGAAVLRKP